MVDGRVVVVLWWVSVMVNEAVGNWCLLGATRGGEGRDSQVPRSGMKRRAVGTDVAEEKDRGGSVAGGDDLEHQCVWHPKREFNTKSPPNMAKGEMILGMPNALPRHGELSPSGHKENCHKLNYLVSRQKELCGLSESTLAAVSAGARMGIDECQHQFKNSRWNCSTFSNTTAVFGGMLSIKSRETAYVYAISSAGVAYAITRACSRGELNECSCDTKIRLKKPRKNWQWGGCSEDIHFGEKFSRDFVDAKENVETAEGLMNLHNNEAGRRSIRSRMQRVCKCHGMSGSCSVRVCWRKLPAFRTIGDALLGRFEGASHVKVVEKKRKKVKKLRAISKDLKPPNKTDLVYLQESPDYCELNETLGVLGTRGRMCNRTSLGLDGCRLLCCGRGYQTRMRDVEEKCHCRFVWCCNVVCQMCQYRREEHICN